VLSSVADNIALDGGLSLGEAASIAWSMRGQSIRQLGIPVRSETTADGRYVLYPTESFAATLRARPDLEPLGPPHPMPFDASGNLIPL